MSGLIRRLPWGRVVVGAALLAAAPLLVGLVGLAQGPHFGVDVGAHLLGARLVLDGQGARLYDLALQARVEPAILPGHGALDPFASPPWVALLYVPLELLRTAGVSVRLLAALWDLASLAAVVMALHWLWPLVPGAHGLGVRRVLVVVLASYPAMTMLSCGNDTLLTLLALTGGLVLLQRGREGAAGVVWGLLLLKPQYALLLPVVLLAEQRWRALAAFAGTSVVLGLISLAVVGGLGGLLGYAAFVGGPYLHNAAMNSAWGQFSIPALVRQLGASDDAASRVAALGLLGTALLILRAPGPDRLLVRWAAAVLGVLVWGPHVVAYDGVLLLLPALVALHRRPGDPGLRMALAFVGVLFAAVQLPTAAPHLLVVLLLLTRRARAVPVQMTPHGVLV